MLGEYLWVMYVVFPAIGALLFLSISSDVVHRELALFRKREIRFEMERVEAERLKKANEVIEVHPEEIPTDDTDAA